MRPVVYNHIVFDLDGTLIDSRADLGAAVNHALKEMGLPSVPVDVIASYVGEGVRLLMQRALGAAQVGDLDRGIKLFMAYYAAHLLDRTRPYPGIAVMLEGLAHRKVTCSVLSNKPEAMCRTILDGLELLRYFSIVLGVDSLVARKPDPAGIARLCTMTATRRERMLLVGDSIIDLRTARAAGVAFCGVSWGLTPDTLRAASPERIVDRPTELLAIVAGG